MNYTKEQLIAAQQKYNVDYIDNPENYEQGDDAIDKSVECAEKQVEKLISLVE